MKDIKLVCLERKYPGITDRLIEIFGPDHPLPPTTKDMLKWRLGWMSETPFKLYLPITLPGKGSGLRGSPRKTIDEVRALTRELGIHDYFWLYYVYYDYPPTRYQEVSPGGDLAEDDVEPDYKLVICFYDGNEFTLFKMAWEVS